MKNTNCSLFSILFTNSYIDICIDYSLNNNDWVVYIGTLMGARGAESDRCLVPFLTLVWSCHIIVLLWISCSIKMSFLLLPEMLSSEWKKDLDNEYKACIFISYIYFVTLAGKRKKEFCFFNMLRNQRCFYI